MIIESIPDTELLFRYSHVTIFMLKASQDFVLLSIHVIWRKFFFLACDLVISQHFVGKNLHNTACSGQRGFTPPN
jgi:hypothetical protein